MRPNLLNPLFGALTTLSGIGPKVEKLYRRLLGRDEEEARIIDLLFHLPTGVIDRRARPKLKDVVPGTVVTVAVTVDRHRPSPPQPAARALSNLRQRRDRRPDPHLLQRAPRLSRKAAAGRRAALRVRHHRALRPHAADGASRPRGRRGGPRTVAAGRAGLSADRGAEPQPGAQGGRRRVAEATGLTGVAGPSLGGTRALSAICRCAQDVTPAGVARRSLAGEPRLDAARL